MTDLRRLQVVDHLVLISNFGVSTATAAVVVTLCDPRREGQTRCRYQVDAVARRLVAVISSAEKSAAPSVVFRPPCSQELFIRALTKKPRPIRPFSSGPSSFKREKMFVASFGKNLNFLLFD